MSMLVLSRKPTQEIIIAGHIRVRIIKVRGNIVKVGVDAPEDVIVDRLEVHERRESAAAGEGV